MGVVPTSVPNLGLGVPQFEGATFDRSKSKGRNGSRRYRRRDQRPDESHALLGTVDQKQKNEKKRAECKKGNFVNLVVA